MLKPAEAFPRKADGGPTRRAVAAGLLATSLVGPVVAEDAVLEFIVFFKENSAAVTPIAMTVLREAAELALKRNAQRIEIVGHCDATETGPQYLSERRAGNVRDALVGMRVPAAIVQFSGAGISHRLVITTTGEPEPQNRRAQINIGS